MKQYERIFDVLGKCTLNSVGILHMDLQWSKNCITFIESDYF